MSESLDQLFSDQAGNLSAQVDRLTELQKSLGQALAAPSPEKMSKDILGGVFTNAPAGGTGGTPMSLRPYDLERPAQLLTPADTPLRNSIPRQKGVGGAYEFRQVLGVSNASQHGGAVNVAELNINTNSETLSTTFGGLTGLRRGPIINYATNQKWVPYTEQSVSDNISYRAVYSSLGFEDPRQLSALALLRSHMRGEEATMLLGRGPVAGGFSGPSAAASPSAATSLSALAGTGTIPSATYKIGFTVRTGVGETAIGTPLTAGVALSNSLNAQVAVPAIPAGTYGVNVYINDATSTYFLGFIPSGTVLTNVVFTALGVKVATEASLNASSWSSNTTANNGYDGLLVTAQNFGTSVAASGTFTAKGDADLQNLFAQMYQAYEGDPDEVWLNVAQAQGLATFLRSSTAGSANAGYRFTMPAGGAQSIGEIVTGVRNASSPTQKLVDIRVHWAMPVGIALVRSKVVPSSYHATGVGATAEVRCVQDYSLFEWPSIDFQYAASTYAMTTMAHYAPFLQGVVTGIGAS
jgi:hypothetical protein